jgi:hypothetical protein
MGVIEWDGRKTKIAKKLEQRHLLQGLGSPSLSSTTAYYAKPSGPSRLKARVVKKVVARNAFHSECHHV